LLKRRKNSGFENSIDLINTSNNSSKQEFKKNYKANNKKNRANRIKNREINNLPVSNSNRISEEKKENIMESGEYKL
jgi:hypothetical protein